MFFALDPIFFFIGLSVVLIADIAVFAYEQYAWSFIIMFGSIGAAYALEPSFATFLQGHWTHLLTHYLPVYLILGLGTSIIKWILYTVKHVNKIKDKKETFDLRNPIDKNVVFEIEELERKNNQSRYEEEIRRRNINKQQMTMTERSSYLSVGGHKLPMSIEEFDKEYPEPTPPEEPVYEPDIMAARRRRAFVEYFKKELGYKSDFKVYEVDYAKETSVVDALTPRAKDHVGLITIWIFQWPIVILCTLFQDFLVKLGKHAARALDAMFSTVSRKLVANATKGL